MQDHSDESEKRYAKGGHLYNRPLSPLPVTITVRLCCHDFLDHNWYLNDNVTTFQGNTECSIMPSRCAGFYDEHNGDHDLLFNWFLNCDNKADLGLRVLELIHLHAHKTSQFLISTPSYSFSLLSTQLNHSSRSTKIKVYVYSPSILVSSADFTLWVLELNSFIFSPP